MASPRGRPGGSPAVGDDDRGAQIVWPRRARRRGGGGAGGAGALQCSCLENPREGEAWWAAVYGVAQSRTRLK